MINSFIKTKPITLLVIECDKVVSTQAHLLYSIRFGFFWHFFSFLYYLANCFQCPNQLLVIMHFDGFYSKRIPFRDRVRMYECKNNFYSWFKKVTIRGLRIVISSLIVCYKNLFRFAVSLGCSIVQYRLRIVLNLDVASICNLPYLQIITILYNSFISAFCSFWAF